MNSSPPPPAFPPGFTWGAAAAAYQLEGAWNADDKGGSVWDMFSRQQGKVFAHQTGDTAYIHVDFETPRRTLKDSALWFRDVIRSNGASLFPSGGRPPSFTFAPAGPNS